LEGECKATWKREFKLPWREADSPDHHDVMVDWDQYVVNEELSLSAGARFGGLMGPSAASPPNDEISGPLLAEVLVGLATDTTVYVSRRGNALQVKN